MRVKVNVEGLDEIQEVFDKIPNEQKQQALRDSAQIILNSTRVGYNKAVSPDGMPWATNILWYKEAKGGAAILTGPLNKTIKRGKYFKKYEFKNVNSKRMKNTLDAKVEGNKAIIEYQNSVTERAELTQNGGESVLELKSLDQSKYSDLSIILKVPPRPHLGTSNTFKRTGSKTDPEHIVTIFEQIIDQHMGA